MGFHYKDKTVIILIIESLYWLDNIVILRQHLYKDIWPVKIGIPILNSKSYVYNMNFHTWTDLYIETCPDACT